MLYLPIADVYVNGYVLLLIGFTVGVLGGFFGIGGAFMVTPALNIIGFPMAFAVGTDLAHIFGKSIVATFKHALLKHVDWVAGFIIGVTGMVGVSGGKWIVLWLTEIGLADSVIRLIYIGFLLSIGAYMMMDYRKASQSSGTSETGKSEEKASRAALYLQSKNLPPMIHLKASGITISLWVLVLLGVFTGAISGLLGVGGGFVRVPMFIYLMGMPTVMAIGTDIFAIFITGAWGAYTYSVSGATEIIAALVMLAGAGVGAQIGALGTAFVKGLKIRLYFALTILVAAGGVILKQLGYSDLAGVVMIGAGCVMTVVVMVLFAIGYAQRKQELAQTSKVIG